MSQRPGRDNREPLSRFTGGRCEVTGWSDEEGTPWITLSFRNDAGDNEELVVDLPIEAAANVHGMLGRTIIAVLDGMAGNRQPLAFIPPRNTPDPPQEA